jgi:AcrR family transcriptional regulator
MSPRRSGGSERSSEIMLGAARLFRERGIKSVSVDDIVQAAGIAKGTFYLYFRTKDDLLARMAEAVIDRMVEAVEAAGTQGDNPIDSFVAAVAAMRVVDRQEQYLADALNHPENTALHELANMALVSKVGPVLAEVVERGRTAGVFDLEDSLSTMQFLLAGQSALLGGGRFSWSPEEQVARLQATLIIIERALGAPKGSITTPLAKVFNKGGNDASL